MPRPSPDSPSDAALPDVALIGAGAVGTALAERMAQAGYPMGAVISRDRAEAAALAEQVGAPVASDAVGDLPDTARIVLLCVPDDAIEPVAAALADQAHPWASTVVAHTSGAHTAEALGALAEAGATTLSFHPMQTFPPGADASAFDDIYIGVEGSGDAVAMGEQMAEALGARSVVVPTAAKTRYHLAASVAANGLVALMGVVEEILASADISPDDAAALVRPLMEQTLHNLVDTSPEAALTGPIARGDAGTIRAHSDALTAHLPHLQPVYAALATELVRIAVRGGQLDSDTAETLLEVLHQGLSTADNGPS